MSLSLRSLLLLSSFSCALESADAQTIYVDCVGIAPPSTYAAAADVPGVWNAMFANPTAKGIYGQSTPVVVDFFNSCDYGGCGLGGDEGALLGQWINGDCYPATPTISIQNLEPGSYRVHLYGYSSAACAGTGSQQIGCSILTQAGFQGVALNVAPWDGSFATANHAEQIITHTGAMEVRIRFTSQFGSGLTAFQLVKLDAEPTAFCFGAQGTCPCGPGAAGRGCPTSYDANGAQLAWSGVPSIAVDTFAVHASGVTDSFMTIVQGSSFTNSGSGIVFGDGLLCAGGTVLRLKLKFGANGILDYPEVGETPISTLGLNTAGATRVYQVWFRDSPSFCTSATFNLTNGVAVVWR